MKEGKLRLRRNYLDNCTLGKLSLDGINLCYTVEKPWLSNKPFLSCVPSGTYDLIPIKNHDKYSDCWYLSNPDLGVSLNGNTTRTEILVHIANFPENVVGCIGPGLNLHPTKWGVSNSGSAMKYLRNILKDDVKWSIEII
jgi:hypothetical protein